MTKRTKVELFEQIRKAHVGSESPSIRDLARTYGVHRRTVRQALSDPVPPARKVTPRTSPSLEPWKKTIQDWIEADRDVPKKQRHTARRIFQRLVIEHGAEVSESSVRRYVALLKANRSLSVDKVCVPQTHPLGEEAEVDFGQFHFYLNGVMVEAWMFVMRLSASGKAFHFASFNQAQEVFIEGHVRAFAHFGGVVKRVRYDNLKTAVVRVLKGRSRMETERFVALRSHYLFDSFFCLPGVAGAHEKGGVEGEIGRFRRRHLVPVPDVASLAELNALIEAGDVLDDVRHVDRHIVWVSTSPSRLRTWRRCPPSVSPASYCSAVGSTPRAGEHRAPELLLGARHLRRPANHGAPRGQHRRRLRRDPRARASRPVPGQGTRGVRARSLPGDSARQGRRAGGLERTRSGESERSIQLHPTKSSWPAHGARTGTAQDTGP